MYEFLDSRRRRELIFQNHAYTRLCKSNVYNCSSKTPNICYAQVILKHETVIITSSYHNHLPPLLTRDSNGILVPKFNVKPEPKIKRRVKPTLGPIATRKEVDSMVASIMSTVKTMENKGDTAANNTGEETTEAETRPTLLKDVTPEIIETRPSVPKNKRMYTKRMTDVTNTGGASAVTSNRNNDQALSLLRMPVPFKEDNPKNNPLEEKPDLSLSNPDKEHSVQREIDRAPLVKNDGGSLIPNQMCIILPESETGLAHNKFVLPTNNAGGLVSPIKSESSTVVIDQTVQPGKIKTGTISSDVVTKKIDGNTVVPTNNMSSIKPKMNETDTTDVPFMQSTVTSMKPETNLAVSSDMNSIAAKKTEIIPFKSESSTVVIDQTVQPGDIKTGTISSDVVTKKIDGNTVVLTNNMSLIKPKMNETDTTDVPFMQSTVMSMKPETNLAVSSDMNSISAKKTEIIPFNARDMINKSYTSQETQTFRAEISSMLNLVPKKIEHDSVGPSKMKPVSSNKTESDNAVTGNIVTAPKNIGTENSSISSLQKVTQEKTESDNVTSSNMQQKTKKQCVVMQPQEKVETDHIVCNNMLLAQKSSSFLESYMRVLSQIDISEEVACEETLKKSGTITVVPNKMLTTKTDTDSTTSGIIQPIEPKEIVFENDGSSNKESIAKKTKTVDYMNTNQATDIDFTETSVVPEVVIPVSMIPLPQDNPDPSVTRTMDEANAGALRAERVPLVMIERLPMKHKAGSSNLRSVPPKKRYYPF